MAIQRTDQELDELGQSLCRSIAGNRFEEARQIADKCVAMHTVETHQAIISILENARRLAMIQRSLAFTRLANIQSADRYASDNGNDKHYLTKG